VESGDCSGVGSSPGPGVPLGRQAIGFRVSTGIGRGEQRIRTNCRIQGNNITGAVVRAVNNGPLYIRTRKCLSCSRAANARSNAKFL
jgi:hypothetical protein